MTKEVIIYGGAFNPPTMAHHEIAQAAINYAAENDAEFWLMLSGERADKYINVPVDVRVALGSAMLDGLRIEGVNVELVDHELNLPMTQSIDTVSYLKEHYPDRHFTWLFGSDSLQTMPKWSGGDWLLKHLDMLIVEREGYEVEYEENMQILPVTPPLVSSTEVRDRLLSGRSVEGLVAKRVAEVLSNHKGLYS